MGLIFYLLGCYGLTTILVQSKIFKPIREFFKGAAPGTSGTSGSSGSSGTSGTSGTSGFIYSLLTCMLCTGFWIGVLTSTGFKYSISYSIFSNGHTNLLELLLYTLFDGAIVSGIMYLMFLIQLNLERHVKDEI
jgi:hypothetical protein